MTWPPTAGALIEYRTLELGSKSGPPAPFSVAPMGRLQEIAPLDVKRWIVHCVVPSDAEVLTSRSPLGLAARSHPVPNWPPASGSGRSHDSTPAESKRATHAIWPAPTPEDPDTTRPPLESSSMSRGVPPRSCGPG